MNSLQIEEKIKRNGATELRLKRLIAKIAKETSELEREYLVTKENESLQIRNSFLKSLGIDNEQEARKHKYIVFNKKGQFVRTVDYHAEFKNFQEFEKWLKINKLYAHDASSFCDRHDDWYKLILIEQLENLDWPVKNGILTKLDW